MGQETSSAELQRMIETEKFVLFDVRKKEDFERGAIEGAAQQFNIPYYDLIEGENEIFKPLIEKKLNNDLPKEMKIVVACVKGISSAHVTELLVQKGYQATSLAGGMSSWNQFYHTKQVVEETNLQIFQYIRPSKGCLSYVVISGGEAVVIDPGLKVKEYSNLLDQLEVQLKMVLDTHAHADHLSGGCALAHRYGVPYGLHPYDGIHPMDVVPARFDYALLWKDQAIRLGEVEIQVLHVPGHTLGNTALLVDQRYLIGGDTIFIGSIARPDLGGQVENWTKMHYHSLNQLMLLGDEITVFPGHFGSLEEKNENHTFAKKLGDLKKENVGLQKAQKSFEEFREYILSNLPQNPKEYADIKRVNLGLMEATATLETGKNVCGL